MAEHFARGNIKKELRIGAGLHDGKVAASQHQQNAVRLDGTWYRYWLAVAGGEVDRFAHSSRGLYRLALIVDAGTTTLEQVLHQASRVIWSLKVFSQRPKQF